LNQYHQFVGSQQSVLWNIKGQLQQPGHDITDWRLGVIELVDLGPDVEIKMDGEYEINVQVPAGKTFESVVQQIYYTTRNGSALLVPSDALRAYTTDHSKSLLQAMTPSTRVYRPMLVTIIPDSGAPQ
jgi:hypothetical protein